MTQIDVFYPGPSNRCLNVSRQRLLFLLRGDAMRWFRRSGVQASSTPARAEAVRFHPRVEELEDRCVPTTAFAISGSSNLVRFDTGTPGTIGTTLSVTGLQNGESLLSLSVRPLMGQVYALGSSSRLYSINLLTGAATALGSTPFGPALSGSAFGFTFNPSADRLASSATPARTSG